MDGADGIECDALQAGVTGSIPVTSTNVLFGPFESYSRIVHKKVAKIGHQFPGRRAFFIFAASTFCSFFIAARETASTLFV